MTSSLGWFQPPQDISLETYEFSTQKPAQQGDLRRIFRKYVTLPDGSRHELRRDDALHNIGESLSGTYYAVDGSRLVYDKDSDTLYLPNGSRYLSVSTSPQLIDRNGNRMISNLSSNSWADTLGRNLAIPGTAPAAGDQTYSLPGVNNTTRTYTLRWRNLGDALTDPQQSLHYMGDAPNGNCGALNPQPNNLFSSQDAQQKVLQFGIHNPVVLYQIVLPNNSSYTFTYNVYGEIDKIVYPTGGHEQFTYGALAPLGGQLDDGTYGQANRGVSTRVVSDGVTAQTWQYNTGNNFDVGVDPATAPRWVIAPDGTRTVTWYYKSRGTEMKYGFDDARTGMTREERVYNSAGAMLRRTLYQLVEDGPQAGGYATATRNARVIKKVDIILDTGGSALAAATEMTYDSDLNVTSTKHYDYVSISQTTAQTGDLPAISNGTLLRNDEAKFLVNDPAFSPTAQAAYRARNLVALPTASCVKDGVGNIVAQSSINYDEGAFPLLTYSSVFGWSDPGTAARGNPTTSGTWLDTTGVYLQTHAQYDQSGSVRNTWDAKGNQSQVEYSNTFAYAYPTLTRTAVPDPTGAYGSNTSLVSTTTYDFNTGLITATTDPNNQTTNFSYIDPQTSVVDSLNRLRTITRPDGGLTTYNYNDTPGSLSVQMLTKQDATRSIEATQYFDALGRPSRSFLNVGGGSYNTSDTQYDSMGRVSRVSNPYVSTGPGSAVNSSGNWTTSAYDALGRVISVTTADGAQVITAYSASTSVLLGTIVTVTDQAGTCDAVLLMRGAGC